MTSFATACIAVFLVATYMTPRIDAQASKISAADIQAIVDTINSFRSALATGTLKDSSGKAMDKSNNMLKVVWDTSLAADAQKWADSCKYGHSESNDRKAGENLYASASSSPTAVRTVLVDGIKSWWNELTKDWKHRADNVFTGKESGVVGHFTQLAWADSYKVGCGYAECKGKIFNNNKMPNDYYLVCRFRDIGNYVTLPIYNPSKAACTAGQKCSASKTQPNSVCGADGLCTVA